MQQDAPDYCIGKVPRMASGALRRLPGHALGAVFGPRPHVELIRQSRRLKQGEVAKEGEVTSSEQPCSAYDLWSKIRVQFAIRGPRAML